MTIAQYLKDKLVVVTLNGIGAVLLSLYLLTVRNSMTTVLLLAIVWFLILLTVLAVNYRIRSQYFNEIENLMTHMDHPYLVHELLENPWRLEDQLYRSLLQLSGKAALEQINHLQEVQQEYREFIEGWIHEVKLPITGMQLAYHNEKQGENRKIEAYLTELDNMVDQVLFYARSNQVFQDYQVTKTDLRQSVLNVIRKNKYILIQNQMSATDKCGNERAMTDRKWLEFILSQILSNAVKYKKNGSGEITFQTEDSPENIRLHIQDNGIGIAAEEIDRIFEKGFTGSNGRNVEKSTGIGLYLCRKLCYKLEISIDVESAENEYTKITLTFPKNTYLSKL